MDNFAIDGPSGIPQDPRPRGEQVRRSDAPRKKGSTDPVAYKTGDFLREIESRKSDLLQGSFLRLDQVESAREDLDAGRLTTEDAIDEAAEYLLRDDEIDRLDLDDIV